MNAFLERYADGRWVPAGSIGAEAGRRFLRRCRDQYRWRLRQGRRVWQIDLQSGCLESRFEQPKPETVPGVSGRF